MGTNSEEDGCKTLIPQIIKGEIESQSLAGLGLDAQAENILDFLVQYLWRKPVVGDAQTKHAPEHREPVKDGDLVTLQP